MHHLDDNPIRPVFLASEQTLRQDAEFVRRLLQKLQVRDISPLLVACDCPSQCHPALDDLHVVSYPEFNLPLMDLVNMRRLSASLERHHPTLLHCLSEELMPLANTLATQLDLNIIVNVNRLQTCRSQLSISNRRCRMIAVPCASVRDSVISLHRRYADRVREINPSAGMGASSVSRRVAGALPSLVVAADGERSKPLYTLLRCFRRLHDRGCSFMAVLLVGGRQEPQIRQWLHELRLGESVTLVPRMYAWQRILAAGDAFIVPAPMVRYDPRLIEAMRLGLVVIACAGGVDDLLKDEKTAWVIKPDGDVRLLVILQRLMKNPDRCQALVATCRQTLQQILVQDSGVEPWLDCYQRISTSPADGLAALV